MYHRDQYVEISEKNIKKRILHREMQANNDIKDIDSSRVSELKTLTEKPNRELSCIVTISKVRRVTMFVNINAKYYAKRLALSNINNRFPKGKMTLIIGTSGAGKSTVIKCITGMTSFKGSISDYQREDIGYIPQFPALNDMETVEDVLFWSGLFSRKYRSWKALRQEVIAYIGKIGLTKEKNHRISELSGGQKQRVSIAKELIRSPNIIIADEIDTGLDAGVSRYLVKIVRDITHEQNKTTIVISHNLSNMDLYDRVVVLVRDSAGTGRIAYSGSVSDIKQFFGVNTYASILEKLNSKGEGGKGEADYYIKKYDQLMNERNQNAEYN